MEWPDRRDHHRALSWRWLNETKATVEVRATAMTMRNFFLADPDDLSLLVYVDQFATGGNPAGNALYRLRGGNDRLAGRMARALRRPVRLRHVIRRIAQKKTGVLVTVESGQRRSELSATCALVTAPAPLATQIEFVPDLPEAQRDALRRVKYGPATKTLLQFERASWRRPGKPRACATDPRWAQCGTPAKTSGDKKVCSPCSPEAARARQPKAY